jgi:hypothetical protein
MTLFLRLKHWQLFIMVFVIPAICQIIFMTRVFSENNPRLILQFFPVLLILYCSVLFGWYYALATNLQKKLPETVKMNVTRFRWFFFIPAVYILFLCVFLFSVFGNMANGFQPNPVIFFVIVPVHLFSIFCILYCLLFTAKALKSVELQKPVTFSDFSGEFFLIWFFPIGVWFIQPRINKLFVTE